MRTCSRSSIRPSDQCRRPDPQGARGAALPCAPADAVRCRMTAALDTYAELCLAEGKLLRWGEREAKAVCALQARDLEILVALARYRFLTTGQIAELWWQGRGLRVVRRRMTRLFDAGFVERFRPQTLRGSYQWTYCLARDGFRAAAADRRAVANPEVRAAPRADLRLPLRHPRPARQRVGPALPRAARRATAGLGRPGRVAAEPPKHLSHATSAAPSTMSTASTTRPSGRSSPTRGCDMEGATARSRCSSSTTARVASTRTTTSSAATRPSLRAGGTGLMPQAQRPAVVFVCQDAEHRDRFLAAADWQLAASQRRWAELNPQDEYPVRDRVLFAIEEDIRAGRAEAIRPPHHPPAVSDRDERSRRLATRRAARLRSTPCPPIRSARRVPSCGSVPSGTRAPTRRRPKTPIAPVLHEEGGSTASRWTPLPRHAR